MKFKNPLALGIQLSSVTMLQSNLHIDFSCWSKATTHQKVTWINCSPIPQHAGNVLVF